jgi:hypothetical protein
MLNENNFNKLLDKIFEAKQPRRRGVRRFSGCATPEIIRRAHYSGRKGKHGVSAPGLPRVTKGEPYKRGPKSQHRGDYEEYDELDEELVKEDYYDPYDDYYNDPVYNPASSVPPAGPPECPHCGDKHYEDEPCSASDADELEYEDELDYELDPKLDMGSHPELHHKEDEDDETDWDEIYPTALN